MYSIYLITWLLAVVLSDEFMSAVSMGQFDRVVSMVQADPSLLETTGDSTSALHYAASNDYCDVAKFLIERGMDVNIRDGYEQTPLHEVTSREMACMLLENGADIDAVDRNGRTPLMVAAWDRRIDVAAALLERGAELDFRSAVQLGDIDAVSRFLFYEPHLIQSFPEILFDAVPSKNRALVELLLKKGSDPSQAVPIAGKPASNRPLGKAFDLGEYEIAALLLEYGANPNAGVGLCDGNPLLYSIAYLEPEQTKLLLDHCARTEIKRSDGRVVSELHAACSFGGSGFKKQLRNGEELRTNHQMVEALIRKVTYLIEAGCDVNARSALGITPMMAAALVSDEGMCEFLLSRGAILDLPSACLLQKFDEVHSMLSARPELLEEEEWFMATPVLQWAVRGGDIKIVRYLLDLGVGVDERAPQLEHYHWGGFTLVNAAHSPGVTALHVATMLGYEPIVQLLIERGADPRLTDGAHSALDLACLGQKWSIARMLLALGEKVGTDIFSESSVMKQLDDAGLLWDVLKSNEAFDYKSEIAQKILANAMEQGHAETVRLLKERGTRIDIYTACAIGNLDEVRRMVDASPEILNLPSGREYSLLEMAFVGGNVELARFLLERTPEQKVGEKALRTAVMIGYHENLKLLSPRDLLDARFDNGATLLHFAALAARPDVVRYLLEIGFDVDSRDFSQLTPLYRLGKLATLLNWDKPMDEDGFRRVREVAKLLIDAGADVNARSVRNSTPLHMAAANCFPDVVRLLLENGAQPNARNGRDRTPLQHVRSLSVESHQVTQRDEVIRLLLEWGGEE